MTDDTTRRAIRLHTECERRDAARFTAHTPRGWDQISQAERNEYFAVTKAILAGEPKYDGTKIPSWAKMIVEEPL